MSFLRYVTPFCEISLSSTAAVIVTAELSGKLHSTNFEGMELIRPLYLVREEDIIRWRDYNHLQFIQCACRFTESCASCGGTEKGSKRAEIKALIKELSAKSPYIEKNIFRSVENVNLNTIVAYKQNGQKHSFLEDYDSKY